MPLTVLIVEDEPVIASDISHVISQAGYNVVGTSASVGEAKRAFDEFAPDFLIVDIQLYDDSSGLDFATYANALRHIPILFLTAFPERLLGVTRPDPTYLVTKPFQPETLISAIDQMLGRLSNEPPPSPKQRAVHSSIADALETLRQLGNSPYLRGEQRLGENESALVSPLSSAEIEALRKQLSDLFTESKNADEASVSDVIQHAQKRVSDWGLERLHEVQQGFFTHIGESLADWKLYVALWLVMAGKLEVILEALKHLHR